MTRIKAPKMFVHLAWEGQLTGAEGPQLRSQQDPDLALGQLRLHGPGTRPWKAKEMTAPTPAPTEVSRGFWSSLGPTPWEVTCLALCSTTRGPVNYSFPGNLTSYL